MRKIIAIIRKDVLLRFSSVTEWLFFLILPVIFTFIVAGGSGGPSDPRILLMVVDQANSSLSTDLLNALQKSDTIRIESTSLSKAEEGFSQRRVSAILIIPADFSIENLAQGPVSLEVREQPNNLNALVAEREIGSIVGRASSSLQIASGSVSQAERIQPFLSTTARQSYFTTALENAQSLLANAPDRLDIIRGSTPDQIEYDPQANSSAGQLITWVFIPLIGLSALFAYERQKGTLKRLLTTPTSKVTYLMGTITGQVLVAILQMGLLIGFGILVMDVNWGSNIPALSLIMLVSALAAASLGTMMGTFVRTEGQASGLSIMIGMLMALLGGCWYPLELFPAAVQQAVKILPTTWAMQGMLDVSIRGQGLSGIMPEAGVLLAFAVIFFAVGILRFRFNE